ncbi:exosortase B [Methylotenera sp.]|uniref:exosortase B n=1 Tax=Methylotenera sp. TaxID=2051956 RepID=UPI002733E9E1|nr:exosortase B [Methylotenera sp.]MDP3776336.1 exosortase B [Methylotenera sp.]
MSTTAQLTSEKTPVHEGWRWLPIIIGLLAICIPSFFHLMQTTWQTEENGHGPIILMVVCWLILKKRHAVLNTPNKPSAIIGWVSLVLSLLAFIVGRSQSIDTIEVAALIPMLIGILLLMRGWEAVRAMWFPLVFMFFLIPLPGLLVEIITGSLKQHVSGIAEEILYAAGYPIARIGVMLSIGQYKLLVADACSGLNSMFSLSALGLIYLYLMKYRSWLHNGIMLLAILPIAFAANVIRVMALVLITYYFGDEAGQGFAHMAAGMLLFVAALMLLMAFDVMLRLVFFRERGTS